MADIRTQLPAIPEDLRGLDFDQATPEQQQRMLEYIRAGRAALEALSPEERERRRAVFLRHGGCGYMRPDGTDISQD